MAMKAKPRIWVLAAGDATGGGSGFQEMVEYTRTVPAILSAEIVGVTSNHPSGGVFKKARALGMGDIFDYWPGPYAAVNYLNRFFGFGADYVMCSGWLKPVSGLDPAKTINIHPALLPEFGGKGIHGSHAHDAVMAAYMLGKVKQSGVTMHFVTDYEKQKLQGVKDPYDKGPIIARFPVLIRHEDTPETLAKRVNEVERVMQSRVLDLIVNGHIWLEDDKAVRYNFFATAAISAMGGMLD